MPLWRDGVQVVYFTKLIHLWLHKANQKLELLKPQADAAWQPSHSPAISAAERKPGKHHLNAAWLISSTKLDDWNSKAKGKRGFKAYSLLYRYALWICSVCSRGVILDYIQQVFLLSVFFMCSVLMYPAHSCPLFLLFISIQAKGHMCCGELVASLQNAWLDTRSCTQANSHEPGRTTILEGPIRHFFTGSGSSKKPWLAKANAFWGVARCVGLCLVQSDIDPALRHLRMAAIQRNKCHTHKWELN